MDIPEGCWHLPPHGAAIEGYEYYRASALQLMPAPLLDSISARDNARKGNSASSGLPSSKKLQKAATGNRVGELVSSDFP
jgi:hypothetical protein